MQSRGIHGWPLLEYEAVSGNRTSSNTIDNNRFNYPLNIEKSVFVLETRDVQELSERHNAAIFLIEDPRLTPSSEPGSHLQGQEKAISRTIRVLLIKRRMGLNCENSANALLSD